MAAGNSIPKLVISVLLCQAEGGIGGIFSNEGVREWSPNLEKPYSTPTTRSDHGA